MAHFIMTSGIKSKDLRRKITRDLGEIPRIERRRVCKAVIEDHIEGRLYWWAFLFRGRHKFTPLPNCALLPNYISLSIINTRRHDSDGGLTSESEERSILRNIWLSTIRYYVSSSYNFQFKLVVMNFSSSLLNQIFMNSVLIQNNLFA